MKPSKQTRKSAHNPRRLTSRPARSTGTALVLAAWLTAHVARNSRSRLRVLYTRKPSPRASTASPNSRPCARVSDSTSSTTRRSCTRTMSPCPVQSSANRHMPIASRPKQWETPLAQRPMLPRRSPRPWERRRRPSRQTSRLLSSLQPQRTSLKLP
ncbi:hypothetical protein OXX79_009756, partial [Metschnikowia pulcherrima]